ncbi:hypothetical protein OS493_017537 [Desmophyllum pertusum]|uniref:Uncharacterized protein n=1 Tax=Desmophyllum pertusum TaxID=174260 RepID=A0A9W9ZPK3_9CNID|nr:hypothetical protein OS493_017537 [Desmophyllum pertusum]
MPCFNVFPDLTVTEPPPAKRFASLSESELDELVNERHSKTREITNWSVATFHEGAVKVKEA